jgi:hypothetical protein
MLNALIYKDSSEGYDLQEEEKLLQMEMVFITKKPACKKAGFSNEATNFVLN